jgi:hypothetical protein
MNKLIGTVAAAVLAMSTLTVAAAAGQGAASKAGDEARAKPNKSANAKPAKGARRAVSKPTTVERAVIRGQRSDGRFDSKAYTRHLKADEKELKWYRSNLKAAEKSGDSRRARRYRANIARLEREIRVQQATIQDHQRRSRTASRGFRNAWWPWWRT